MSSRHLRQIIVHVVLEIVVAIMMRLLLLLTPVARMLMMLLLLMFMLWTLKSKREMNFLNEWDVLRVNEISLSMPGDKQDVQPVSRGLTKDVVDLFPKVKAPPIWHR